MDTKCNHDEYEIVRMSLCHYHYGKRICKKCKKFIKWEKDPDLTILVEKRNNIIDRILKDEILNTHERHFLESIKEKRILTDKQERCFDSMMLKYG